LEWAAKYLKHGGQEINRGFWWKFGKRSSGRVRITSNIVLEKSTLMLRGELTWLRIASTSGFKLEVSNLWVVINLLG
jgi:hypothetical protein